MRCKECYSENPGIIPFNGARNCLENHKQYICSKCGGIICIDLDGERKTRCFFPFSTKETAVLYLKCENKIPVYKNNKLTKDEIEKYLLERKEKRVKNN